MVTNQQTNVPVNQFQLYDNVAMEIENIFNPLIEQLITRRDTLLTKLQTMKEDFVTKETTRKATIEELGRVIKQMQEESMKLTRWWQTSYNRGKSKIRPLCHYQKWPLTSKFNQMCPKIARFRHFFELQYPQNVWALSSQLIHNISNFSYHKLRKTNKLHWHSY